MYEFAQSNEVLVGSVAKNDYGNMPFLRTALQLTNPYASRDVQDDDPILV